MSGGSMSDGTCDVSLGEYDGDEAAFSTESLVTARIPHSCYECRGQIEPRQRYMRVTGKWDGEFETYRFCLPCWEISGEFSEGARAYGITWDTFRDEWAAGATLQGCLNRLTTVATKEHMRRQWLKWKRIT